MKPTHWRRSAAGFAAAAALLAAPAAGAWELAGKHTIRLHPRSGEPVAIGTVEFRPAGDRLAFVLHLDHGRFKDFFLSMREFKCLEGQGEIQCHVSYPYRHPGTVTANDLAWLEHSLLFLFKSPSEFGARLWNGIYYKLQVTPNGLVGMPQAVDLNQIGAPPADLATPPFGPGERSDIPSGARWFGKLTVD